MFKKNPASSRNEFALASLLHFKIVVSTRSSNLQQETKIECTKQNTTHTSVVNFLLVWFKSNSRLMQKSRKFRGKRGKINSCFFHKWIYSCFASLLQFCCPHATFKSATENTKSSSQNTPQRSLRLRLRRSSASLETKATY
jgi:hypothetical protein